MDKENQAKEKTGDLTRPPSFSAQPTHEIEEGPYYMPDSPERTRLFEEGLPGEKLTLTGYVFDIRGKPVVYAWLDFWQANALGEYDNAGFILRGHQHTDNSGKYTLETIIPGPYDIRTAHIHVKVRANPNSPVFTTQIFIPGLDKNRTDFLYRDDLLIDMHDTPDGKAATFNFTLQQ